MLDVGVVGVGTAAGWYANILKRTPHARLAAALRGPGGDTDTVSRMWNVPCFNELDAFLGYGLDAVIIASPSGHHFKQAKAALEAGIHVLVEKPIALNLAEAQTLGECAKKNDLRLGVTFQRRADPLFRAVKNAIDAGGLGTPTLLGITMPYHRNQEYYDSANWRGTYAQDGGGVLMNQGIHLVDLAVWLFGPVSRVAALTATRARHIEVEDTASSALEFENGALGSICGTTASSPGEPHSIQVCGTAGSLHIEGEAIVNWHVPDVPEPEFVALTDSSAADPTQTSTANHERIVTDFVDAIQQGRDPLVTAEAASHSLQVIVAAYASARYGETITTRSVGGADTAEVVGKE